MKPSCIACGGPAEYALRALTVRTLHIRDLSGERRVQTLGDFREGAVCTSCAEKRLALKTAPFRAVGRQLLFFVAVIVLGAALLGLSLTVLRAYRIVGILGAVAMAAGCLCVAGTLLESRRTADSLRALSQQEAMETAAYDVFISCLPTHDADENLTYIPASARILSR